MALDLTLIYPGQIDTTDPAGYPQGKAKNIVSAGDGTGTPWEKQIANDNLGFLQNLLDRASLSPSGTPDKVGASQYTTGVEAVATDIVAPTEAVVRSDLVASRGCFAHVHQAQSGFDTVNNRPHWEVDSTAGAAQDVRRAFNSTGVLSWGFAAGSDLPFSCNVNTVRVFVKQALAYVAGQRMKIRVSTRDSITLDSAVVADEEADPGTAIQSIDATGLDIDLIATNTLVFPPGPPLDLTVTLFAGVGTPPLDDLAYLCEVRYTLAIL